MTEPKWLVKCNECQWVALVFRQEDAEAAKRAHTRSTGHRNVTIHPVTKGDSGWRAASVDRGLVRGG